MTRAPAPAKINLSLVVGPVREDGKHELVTVFQRVALSDRIAVERSPALSVSGFAGDTLVRRALELMTEDDGVSFAARIQKRVPVAAGLGGGSSDAATALRLANALRPDPYPAERLRKGHKVFAEGALRAREWEGKDGQKRTSLEIRFARVQSLERREPGEGGGFSGGGFGDGASDAPPAASMGPRRPARSCGVGPGGTSVQRGLGFGRSPVDGRLSGRPAGRTVSTRKLAPLGSA